MSDNNLDELDYLYKRSFICEIVEKNNSCAFQWTQIATNQWHTSIIENYKVWDFYLTALSDQVILDVTENKSRNVIKISSDDDSLVDELYQDITTFDSGINDFIDSMQTVGECPELFVFEGDGGVVVGGGYSTTMNYNLTGTGGVTATGDGDDSIVTKLLPYVLTIVYETGYEERSPVPWTGAITDIIDSENIEDHDGDGSYLELTQIPYSIDTEFSSNYVLVGFDTSTIDMSSSIRLQIDVAYSWTAWETDVQDFYSLGFDYASPALGLISTICGNVDDIAVFSPGESVSNGVVSPDNHLDARTGYHIQSFLTDPIDSNLVNENIQFVLSCFTTLVTGTEYGVSITDEFGNPISTTFTADWQQLKVTAITITILN